MQEINTVENIDISINELHEVLPAIFRILKKAYGVKNAVSTNEIIFRLNRDENIVIKAYRVKAIVNYIRKENIISCLVGNSKGYFIERNRERILDYCDRLKKKAVNQLMVVNALKRQLEENEKLSGKGIYGFKQP